MNNTYYAIELEDYSIPPFCSGVTQTYAGTEEQLADFMGALSKSRSAENLRPLLDAYHSWLQGEPAGVVEHDFCQCWNIRPLETAHIIEMDLTNFSIEHLNAWRCPYLFQADSAHVKVVYAKDGDQWYRFVQAAFRNLQWEGFGGEFVPVDGWFWGHPAMLKLIDGVTFNRLLFQERKLGGKEAMLQDVAVPGEIDFSGFMKDILGDG